MKTLMFTNHVCASCVRSVSRLALLLGAWMATDLSRCPAQGTIYASRAGFDAALASGTTITFDGVAPNDPSGTGVSSVNASGVTFTNFDSRLFVSSQSLNPILYNFDSGYPVGIFLPGGKNAFGADFSGGIVQNNPFNATISVNLADGQSSQYHFTGQLGAWTFVGFIFSQPIASLVYDDGGISLPGTHEEMLDNVSFGTAVPEPRTPLLFVLALIATFGALRLKLA